MRSVHVAKFPGDAHLVSGLLAAHGIEAVLHRDPANGVEFDFAGVDVPPSVCVAEADVERAEEIIRKHKSGQA